ncbi:YcjX family protein [Halomonas sp. MCCC 1A17488]|uniref:YcjX family protein n=1 Tax=unclassified Halomonas TaxID=2609666 RepID=UPI0018D2700D|nr:MULTISPECIES: YcjX family protein [unclassified Halomonas]MCE8015866.1 YcjX family protein [Halomonas sp. MCCC 1A17488]MCG3239199.1 YcjX family protein [Halomonas sp. MCCC 1A17488]QPP50865.1 YcjX family protein [Halomonas sp. SS10-MC5]
MRQSLTRELTNLIERGRDRQLRLAVTGLSRSGKTAFLTSLVNQLRHAGLEARLDLMPAARQGRLLGARRVSQPDLGVPRFPYDQAMASLDSEPPRWPEPTRGISELRLSIRYRPARRALLRGETAELSLDLFDYPGEWLLDLPLLGHDYPGWSRAMLAGAGEQRRALLAEWERAAARLDPAAEANEAELADIAALYARSLQAAREAGFANLQPGRFLLPGDLEGAPVLQFFPLPALAEADEGALAKLPPESVYATLAARFRHYQHHIVRPFYRDHFRRFDRQIVLVDVLGALNAGPERFEDLSQALATLMQSFDYGKRSLLSRLFAPRIDKLAIAATKADHVTPEQHANLTALLEALLAEPLQDLRYANVPVKALSLAAIRATEAHEVNHRNERSPALRGTTLEGEEVLVFPGEVPAKLPETDFWARQGFDFRAFRPAPREGGALPHIRLDAALDWLIGDKLQ